MNVYLVAGESSGDTHATGLIQALRIHAQEQGQTLTVRGAGGPLLSQETEGSTLDWIEKAGVVGLWEVLKMYSWFRAHLHRMKREIMDWNPDCLILVDYPGFNLRLAQALRKAGWKGKIVAYISPQVWAWKKGRIQKMARMLDAVLCLFPFEPEIYRPYGLHAEFTGHPMIDRLKAMPLQSREPNWIGLFPGSRRHEVARLFPVMLQAADALLKSHPHLHFYTPAASAALQASMQGYLDQASPEVRERTHIRLGGSQELMQRVWAAWIASGTATLEATCLELPYVLVYKVNPLTWEVGKRLVKIPFLGMANILSGHAIVPELLQEHCTPESMVSSLRPLLQDSQNPASSVRRETMLGNMRKVISKLKGDEALTAYQNAAIAIQNLVLDRS